MNELLATKVHFVETGTRTIIQPFKKPMSFCSESLPRSHNNNNETHTIKQNVHESCFSLTPQHNGVIAWWKPRISLRGREWNGGVDHSQGSTTLKIEVEQNIPPNQSPVAQQGCPSLPGNFDHVWDSIEMPSSWQRARTIKSIGMLMLLSGSGSSAGETIRMNHF